MTGPSKSRALWLEAHLLSERTGRRALRDSESLGPETHEDLLERGDRLAEASVATAQRYFLQAARIRRELGEAELARWYSLGAGWLDSPTSNREAALAFFTVPARAVARRGVDHLAQWCETARELIGRSRKLGATYLKATAPLHERATAEALRQFAQPSVELFERGGWRGELSARAYLQAAPHVLGALAEEDFGAWADLGAALGRVIKESDFFGELPAGLANLRPEERRALLRLARKIAEVDDKAALSLYRELPAALRRTHTKSRAKLLDVLDRAAPVTPRPVAELLPVLSSLVRDIPGRHRQEALDHATRVAREFPVGGAALLRCLPAAYEDVKAEAVAVWIERGIQIAADNEAAGCAYFALESRTSVKVLHASSTSATLTEMQGVLRKYVQMLSGRPVSIRTSDYFQLRGPLEEFPLEDEIALPAKIDPFPTLEENARLYRFLAAQLAARREYGTYEIDLGEEDVGLLEYLRREDTPELLEDFFLVAEGYRVALAARRAYPGLAREQEQLARRLLARADPDHPQPHAATLDLLYVWLLADSDITAVPGWLRSMAAIVGPCVAPLAAPQSTARDSLEIARQLAGTLERIGGQSEEVVLDELAFERLTGEALFDQYGGGDEDVLSEEQGDAPAVEGPETPPSTADASEDSPTLPLQDEDDGEAEGAPMSPEELKQLLDAGVDLQLKQGRGNEIDGLGLYISDLLGKVPQEQLEELRSLLQEGPSLRAAPKRWSERRSSGSSFYYDEWDYHIGDYRERWCRLLEVAVEGDSGEFFNETLLNYSQLIPDVRRQFQKIRPEMYRVVRGLEDGEDFDLNAVVNARVDRRARQAASTKLYVARQREERDVATLFLIDLSASTDEPMEKIAPATHSGEDTGENTLDAFRQPMGKPARKARRIIDVTKEALVIMAEALDEIGDAYAIYGFSGHGRHNVELYLVKSFKEKLSAAVKGRIGALEPKRSTRMGAALRHATEKMAVVSSRSRHIIMLSDGFPQDFDYGQDRRSNVYGLRDTTMALREAEASGVTPFCITVDKAGHDYLREMCEESRYMVIDDIASLPSELPKIYQRVVGS